MRISDWSSDVCSSDLQAVDHAGIDLLSLFDAIIQVGEDVARAGGGFGLALDLHPVAARRDIDAKPVFDRDEIAVELTEEDAQKLRSLEFRRQSDAVAGLGGGGGGDRKCVVEGKSV